MIVTCPACSSRYQFDEARLAGRSAKITCPTCAHVYLVHPPQLEPALGADTWPSAAADGPLAAKPSETTPVSIDIQTADFSAHGVTWKVKQGLGLIHDFSTLEELQEALDDGVIGRHDAISSDGKQFQPIASIPDLAAHFQDAWSRAVSGELRTANVDHYVIGDGEDEDEDAPTTIVRTGGAFSLDIDGLDDDAPQPKGEAVANPLAPPPPAPLNISPSTDPVALEPPTEDASAEEAQVVPSAIPTAPITKPAVTEPAASSPLALAGFIVVVLVVIGLILYRQGLLDGLLSVGG